MKNIRGELLTHISTHVIDSGYRLSGFQGSLFIETPKKPKIIQEEKVSLVGVEPFYSDKAARHVASGTSARVVVTTIQVGGEPEATDTFSLMDLIVRRLTAQ